MQRKSPNNKNTRYTKPGICKSYLRSLAVNIYFVSNRGSDRKITSKQENNWNRVGKTRIQWNTKSMRNQINNKKIKMKNINQQTANTIEEGTSSFIICSRSKHYSC